jgi:hypothetical protein
MEKPYIDGAINILSNLKEDIPYIDTVIRKLIYLKCKKFGVLEVSFQNGAIRLISPKQRILMEK